MSGGEPTIDTGLPAFLSLLKERGLQVKLDSNGLAPDVINSLLEQHLLSGDPTGGFMILLAE